MKVYVLLFHDVWDVSEAEPEGGPKDVSIEGIFATHEAAEAAVVKYGLPVDGDDAPPPLYDNEGEPERDVRAFFTIQEHEVVSPLSWTLVPSDAAAYEAYVAWKTHP